MFKAKKPKATMSKATTAIVSLLFVACVCAFFHPASAPLAATGIVSALFLVLLLVLAEPGADSRPGMRRGRRLLRYVAPALPVLLLPALSWAGAGPTTFDSVVTTLSTGSITLVHPAGSFVDPQGNIYIADVSTSEIVEVTAAGVASVLAFPGLSPALVNPRAVVKDGSGNLYVADASNARVVELSAGGVASVLNTGSLLSVPAGLALDTAGDLYIADLVNNDIVEVPAGGGTAAALVITGLGVALDLPEGLAVDLSGNLYIADSGNNRIVKVTPGRVGSVLAISGLVPGLSAPADVALDGLGNLYIADKSNNRIVTVTPAGAGKALVTGSDTLSAPQGVAVSVWGAVYICDLDDARIVEAQPTTVGFGHLLVPFVTFFPTTLTLPVTIGVGVTFGSVQTSTQGAPNLDYSVASTTCVAGTTTGADCTVNVAFVPAAPGLRRGALVLFDNSSTPVPILTVPLYGIGDAPLATLSPAPASVINPGTVNSLNFPSQMALDGAGNMYVANSGSTTVLKIPPGGGSSVLVNTSPLTLLNPFGVALDGAGNLYIADSNNNRIVKVTPAGVATVLTISGLSTALSYPEALTVDAAGNLYIADTNNSRVVKVTPAGVGSVVATGDIVLGQFGPVGVAVDAAGNVYIADSTNNDVVKVTAAGAASLVGTGGIAVTLTNAVAVDGMGNVYIGDDRGGGRIVEVTTAGVTSLVTSSVAVESLFGVTVGGSGNIFLVDSFGGQLVEVTVAGASLTFLNTNVGSTSIPQTATMTNIGDLPLVFSANPTYTTNFSENIGDTNLCTANTSLAPGTVCDVSVEFTPQSAGLLSANVVLTDDSLNNVFGATETVAVSGTGLSAGDSTTVAVSTNPASVNIGQILAITAAVTDTAVGHTATVPTGGVRFTDTVGSTTISLNGGNAVTLNGSGQAILSGVTLSGAGLHTIIAVYPGVSGAFLPSATETTVLVTAAITPTISWTPASGAITYGTTLSGILNATAANGGTAVAGTFTYTATLAGGSAVAVTSTTVLGAGSYTLTATFTPTNTSAYASTGASVPLMVMTAFTVTAPTTPVTVAPGGSVTVNLAVPPLGGAFNSVVTLSASGLPPGATATFDPPTVTPGSAGAPTVMTIQLAAATASLPASEIPGNHGEFPVAPVSLGLVAFGAVLGRKRIPRGMVLVLALASAGIATSLFTGCGGGFTNPQTQAGSYTVTVTGTSGTFQASTTVTVVVQ